MRLNYAILTLKTYLQFINNLYLNRCTKIIERKCMHRNSAQHAGSIPVLTQMLDDEICICVRSRSLWYG